MTDYLDSWAPVHSENGHITRSEGGFVIQAAGKTDLFADPNGTRPVDSAPGVRFVLGNGPVQFCACVAPQFSATFDAGVLTVRTAAGCWAKLAFEFSPARRPTIVSVVTKDTSDDANGPETDAQQVYLRVYWDGTIFAFHYSLDGKSWSLVRLFALPMGEGAPTIELTAQSPVGEGCSVGFGDIFWKAETLSDWRGGS